MHNTQVCMFCRYRRTTAGASALAPCCADRREVRQTSETVAPVPPPARERPSRGAFVGRRH